MTTRFASMRSRWRARAWTWMRLRAWLQTAGRWALGAGLVGATALAILGYLRSDLVFPPASTMLLDRHGTFLGEHAADVQGRHGFWPLESIPSRVAAATLAVEDRRFWEHPGVDLRAIARALSQNLHSGRTVSGASTLAMQVARMQRPGSRTYGRKAVEASTALWLVGRQGREAVLRQYLQLVPYGNQIHGISHAARRYFDKPVADLSWAETAFLAAIPQAPARMNPYDPRGRARAVRRGLQILELLREENALPEDEYRLASRQIKVLRIPPRAQRPEEAMHAILRLASEELAPEKRGARNASSVVRTTLDLELQREVSWKARRSLEKWRQRGAGNVAAMVVELPSPGRPAAEVRAAVGSADFFDSEGAGSIDYLRVPRSSGSTLKPFFYALALDRGLIEPTAVLDDLERGAGGISNADGLFLGPLLPRFALANSRNVPAANLLAKIGLDQGWSLLGRLGLHDGSEGPRRYGLGLTIGSLAVTVEDLASAYTALATDGRQRHLRWLVDEEEETPSRPMSEEAARLVTHFLADTQARLPSFPRTGALELPFPAAFKTGTSSRYRDAWTVAYTPRFLVVVWVGDPDHRPMHRLSGYRTAAYLAREILSHVHPRAGDGLEADTFPEPRGHEQVATCALTGRGAGPACDRVTAEWRRGGAPPLPRCTAHRLVAIEKLGGRLASHVTPAAEVEIRSFVDLPARYAAWQAQAGLPRPPAAGGPAAVGGPVAGASAALAGATRPAVSVATRLQITSPANGLHLFFDPETPKSRNTLALRVTVDPPPKQILWKVDGEPFALADYPFTERWPLEPGDHTIEAEVPFTSIRSSAVRVRVE